MAKKPNVAKALTTKKQALEELTKLYDYLSNNLNKISTEEIVTKIQKIKALMNPNNQNDDKEENKDNDVAQNTTEIDDKIKEKLSLIQEQLGNNILKSIKSTKSINNIINDIQDAITRKIKHTLREDINSDYNALMKLENTIDILNKNKNNQRKQEKIEIIKYKIKLLIYFSEKKDIHKPEDPTKAYADYSSKLMESINAQNNKEKIDMQNIKKEIDNINKRIKGMLSSPLQNYTYADLINPSATLEKQEMANKVVEATLDKLSKNDDGELTPLVAEYKDIFAKESKEEIEQLKIAVQDIKKEEMQYIQQQQSNIEKTKSQLIKEINNFIQETNAKQKDTKFNKSIIKLINLRNKTFSSDDQEWNNEINNEMNEVLQYINSKFEIIHTLSTAIPLDNTLPANLMKLPSGYHGIEVKQIVIVKAFLEALKNEKSPENLRKIVEEENFNVEENKDADKVKASLPYVEKKLQNSSLARLYPMFKGTNFYAEYRVLIEFHMHMHMHMLYLDQKVDAKGETYTMALNKEWHSGLVKNASMGLLFISFISHYVLSSNLLSKLSNNPLTSLILAMPLFKNHAFGKLISPTILSSIIGGALTVAITTLYTWCANKMANLKQNKMTNTKHFDNIYKIY